MRDVSPAGAGTATVGQNRSNQASGRGGGGYRERNFTWESAILEREIDWGEEGTGEKGELVVAGARGCGGCNRGVGKRKRRRGRWARRGSRCRVRPPSPFHWLLASVGVEGACFQFFGAEAEAEAEAEGGSPATLVFQSWWREPCGLRKLRKGEVCRVERAHIGNVPVLAAWFGVLVTETICILCNSRPI